MAAGLPGTGIGGLFYLLLAFLMPIHELIRLIQGKSSLQRWKMVLIQIANASGVLLSLYAMSWVIRHFLAAVINRQYSSLAERSLALQNLQAVTATTLAWFTVAILAAVTTSVLLLRALSPIFVRFRQTPIIPPKNSPDQ